MSNASDASAKMSLEAELALDTVYWRFDGPKAFAIGSNGVWSHHLGGADPAAYAVEDCNKRLGASGGESCFVIARGNDIVLPLATSGMFLWKETPNNARPFSTVEFQKPMGEVPDAIMIMMLDCVPCVSASADPLLGSSLVKDMTLYFVDLASQFRNELNSLDADGKTEQDKIRVFKAAVLKTDQTLQMLKSSHPSVPIIVWGDGLGGYLAQLASEKVDGMIVTGSACMPYYRTPAGVEIRYLYRVSDPRLGWFADNWFGDKLDAVSASRECADAAPSFSTQVNVISEANNVPIAETREFKATVTELLDLIRTPLQ